MTDGFFTRTSNINVIQGQSHFDEFFRRFNWISHRLPNALCKAGVVRSFSTEVIILDLAAPISRYDKNVSTLNPMVKAISNRHDLRFLCN